MKYYVKLFCEGGEVEAFQLVIEAESEDGAINKADKWIDKRMAHFDRDEVDYYTLPYSVHPAPEWSVWFQQGFWCDLRY